jgi:hypothetical protein
VNKLSTLEFAVLFSPEEFGLLEKLCAQFADGNTPASLIAAHRSGVMNIFRAGEGLVLLQTVSEGEARELIVYGLIGRGILAKADEVCADLKAIAREFECGSIGGNVTRPGLKRLYDKLGAKPVSVYYQLELG